MNKVIHLFITFIVFSALSSVGTVYADESSKNEASDQQNQQKNECLLLGKNCGHTVISIQDKIEMLNEEIAKGRAVYTSQELDILQKKLDDFNMTLDFLLED